MTSIKTRYSVANLRKMTIYNPNVDLVIGNVFTEFGLNKCIRSQESIKGRNSVTNLRKMTINNPNVDFVNHDNAYAKFGLNKSILSQDIEQTLNSDVNQGP